MSIHEGSGNVFADLGLSNPEERQAKAQLAIVINRLIEEEHLTQVEAAKRMELAQPDVSDIVRGRLKRFTMDRLMNCLTRLGQDVKITVSPKDPDQPHAQVTVTA